MFTHDVESVYMAYILIFTVRRYASVVNDAVVYPSVRPSVCHVPELCLNG